MCVCIYTYACLITIEILELQVGLENIFSDCGEILSISIRDQPGPKDLSERPDSLICTKKEQYVCVILKLNTCKYRHIYTCMHTRTHIHTHTHTHTPAYRPGFTPFGALGRFKFWSP